MLNLSNMSAVLSSEGKLSTVYLVSLKPSLKCLGNIGMAMPLL